MQVNTQLAAAERWRPMLSAARAAHMGRALSLPARQLS